ncbi:hypothetical protein GCU56_08830 [Geodermatophilus sabuli]|uniref:Uncharacterized protein n=1 Tax=Geodermatophilus sabuli TaxID=1564158 RepID=A0A7K3VZ94_9ACTN|nr:DUF6541 family protein [Geodermatophilus sabuli]NEK57975.1 hypothetical protein [Geodermatophilus sabuli]
MPLDSIIVPVTTLVVLLAPGGLVAVAAGLRARHALATAPVLTYGLAAVAATVAEVVDVPWGGWFLAAEAVVVAGVLWGARARAGGRPLLPLPRFARPGRDDVVVAVGVLLGGLVSLAAMLRGFGSLDRPNQTWDYTYHANITRFIADSGDVAASALRVVNNWDSESFFYPNAHAAIGAVVRDLTGADVFSVLNSQILLLGGVAGLGLAVLLRDLGAPLAVTASTPVLLAGFASFPYDLVWRGPLLPYATGLAVTPAFLLLVRLLVVDRRPPHVVLAVLGGAALFGLQPSTALSAAGLALLMVAQRCWSRRRVDGREAGLLALAAVLTAVVSAPAVVGALRANAGTDVDWAADMTLAEAVDALVVLDASASGPQPWLALCVAAGLLTIRSARYLWWLVAGSAVALLLFVLTAASDAEFVESLTGPWWNDRWRFVALAVLGLAPLAAHGLWRLSLGLVALARRVSGERARRLRLPGRAVVFGGVLAVLLLLTNGLYWTDNHSRIARAYQHDRYLDDAEMTAMAWLSDRIPPGETVMNDSADGSAYLLAVGGVRPVFGHLVSSFGVLGPTQTLLRERFRCLDSDVAVREAIDRLDIGYVFLGSGFINSRSERVTGLRRLNGSPSLHAVYERDGVQVYEVALRPLAERPLPGCAQPAG